MTEQQAEHDIKLIALDMDGTLLNDQLEISMANRQAIEEAQQQGIHVVLSTGRSRMTCREYAESLKLSSYLVTVNGSEIWNEKGELIERNRVEHDLVQWMWGLTQTHKANFWAISSDSVWNNEMPDDIKALEWLKFGFDIEDDQIREIILNELKTKGMFEVTNSSPTNIEVNPLGINKALGIKSVCDRLDITMKEVMAVGDSLNDIAMIKEAGLGIAMGNAQPIVKETADWITATNNEDGVAKAIRKWAIRDKVQG
ncbi:Cof-type HAD-IIB family hydrolase [Bacillus canaveralius]|uniref:Cof-type HAD-IIB family hydrolase n=1 Tax=Bacillus canaveralius TaxID=1403243 RepID=UPI000F776B26|nr:Cof-type HAD-IIB family hydrolase [Bacillus canaveralius]RSK52671.1 HAD family phosphatase [Bacillus canaveralius]